MELWQFAIVFGLIAYLSVCFGVLAKRNGLNPWLWGAIAVVSPINLLVLGYWAIRGRLPFAGCGGEQGNAADSRKNCPDGRSKVASR